MADDNDQPGEVLPGFEQPNDQTMSEKVRRELEPPAEDVPPESDEL